MIDVAQHINAVRRVVGKRSIEAGEGRVVIISRTYDATVHEVWDACTNAERLPRWFLPVSGDLRLHGRFQLEGNAAGAITRCDPPHGFAATWEYGGDISWIELHLSEEPNGRTRFRLEHTVPSDDTKWAEFGPGALGVGWDLALLGLSQHVTTGRPVDRDSAAAWFASDPGRQVMTDSARLWGEAAIDAGESRETAQAAAERTAAAYTGVSGE